MKLYKCDKCGFECASEKLYIKHMEREALGITEREMILKVRKDKLNEYKHNKSR